MANRTTFEQVVDGDQLSQGFFNEIRPSIANAGIFNEITSNNRVSHTFSTDEAQTKTNFTYESETDQYVAKSGSSVLEMPTTNSVFVKGIGKIASGYVKHDYHIATEYDECDDSSVDLALWTDTSVGSFTGNTFSETTDYLQMTYTGAVTTNDTLGFTTTKTFTDEYVSMFLNITENFGNALLRKGVRVKGATSGSAVLYELSGATDINLDFVEVQFDSTNNQAFVNVNGSPLSGSPVDLSSLVGAWTIEVYQDTNGASAAGSVSFTNRLYFLRYVDGSETSTVTESFSSDDGTNYTTVSNKYASITSAQQGYQMRSKITSTVASGELLVVDRVDYQGLTSDEV